MLYECECKQLFYIERKDYYRTSFLISNLLATGVNPSDLDYVSILDIKYGEYVKKKIFFQYFSPILTISPPELVICDKKRGRFQIPSLLPLDWRLESLW